MLILNEETIHLIKKNVLNKKTKILNLMKHLSMFSIIMNTIYLNISN